MADSHFTAGGYARVLEAIAAAGYQACPFREAATTAGPAIIMRHDVDFSIDCALAMAEAEAAHGIRATYFVMLACEHYNLLAKPGRAKIARIRKLGHEIGLHWDSSTYPDEHERVAQVFRHEVAVLGDVSGTPVVSAAQHIPTDSPVFNVEAYIENETYSQRFRERFTYVSDSSMRWRGHTVLDLIGTGVDIHFCSHPEWWFGPGTTATDKLTGAVVASNTEQLDSVRTFLAYMHEVLAERDRYDAEFRAKKGAM